VKIYLDKDKEYYSIKYKYMNKTYFTIIHANCPRGGNSIWL